MTNLLWAGLTKPVGTGSVWAGTKPAQIQNSNLNSKKNKNSQKIPKNTSRCDESNGVKFFSKIRSFSILRGFEVKQKKAYIQKYTNTM